ncbi:MAG: right-handed parallel beta-helix repeat-containing protein [Saprospiraceae bacterium]
MPTYIEIRDNLAWDHSNDPDQSTWNSFDKPYLNYINTLAQQSPGYQDGFNVIITTDGPFFNTYVYNNPDNKPLWELGYVNGQYNGVAYSANPTYDLSHPAMWHAPDRYLIYLNGYDHLGGDWWLETSEIPLLAKGFLHEYGHYFNLNHVNCTNNIMNGGAPGALSLTGCQVREMYQTLMTKNLRKYVICEDRLDFNLTVDTDETWRINTRIFGDVVVKNGATLTITCQVHMSPKGEIVVERGGKLVVDGGLITGDCSDNWKGVVVEGDVPGKQSQSGKVVLKNSAILEHARNAISMNPDHLPWNDGGLQNFYGGLVEAENSTIRNCVRGVEFMRYGRGGIKDKSWFKNVTFENLAHEGVSMWADDGVTFDDCTFKNIGRRGILPFDCEAIVRESNTFESQPIGVDIVTTYPIIFSSKIGEKGLGSNTFLCQSAGVNIQSSGNVEPLTIFNNVFSGSNKGVRQNGNSLLYVENNGFSGHLTAVEIFGGGTAFSHVTENEINTSYLGAHSVQQNSGLRYLDNCFSANQLVDVFVSDGDIFPWQGSPMVAAGNCFTKNDIPEIDNDDGTGPVFYFVKTGTPVTSCKYPENLHNVTLITNAAEETIAACGPTLSPGGGGDLSCDFDESLPIEQLKQQRIGLIQQLGGLANGNDELNRKTLERCIETLESVIGRKMLDPASGDLGAGKENAIAFYTSAGMDFKDWTTAYGIMVHCEELGRARIFVNSLSTQTQDQSDFKTVQNINLDYLAQPRLYEISEANRNYLYAVGTANGALNGYARSLYEVLTGERIEVEIPDVGIEDRESSTISDAMPAAILVYPNPSSNGVFNLKIGRVPTGATYTAMLTDATGRPCHQVTITTDGEYGLSSESLPSGIYFLTVRDALSHTLFYSKLVVFN